MHRALVAGLLLLVTATATSCGSAIDKSSSTHQTASAKSKASTSSYITVTLSSPAIQDSRLPAKYTCDGDNVPPPFEWGPVPAYLRELVLFALEPKAGGPPIIRWSVAGIQARLRRMGSNQLPPGAFLEKATDGKKHYSICPPKGTTTHYVFALYALPPRFSAGVFPGPKLLHNLTEAGRLLQSPIRGELSVTYTRQ